MMEIILGYAAGNSPIRAAVVESLRANPHAPHDRFHDFDITYLVDEVSPLSQAAAGSLFWNVRIML